MKEYLTKNTNSSYQLVNHRFSDDDIEVPEGAIKLVSSEKNHGNIHFINGEGCLYDPSFNNSTWYSAGYHADDYIKMYSAKILWQREPKYKEFLNAKDNYSLVVLPEHAGDDKEIGLIEVPEGAEIYVTQKNTLHGFFAKNNGETLDTFNTIKKCGWHKESTLKLDNINAYYMIIWQRHTQPKELPFIDDNKSTELDKIKIKVDGNIESAIKKAKDLGYWNCQFEKIPSNAYWLLCNTDGTVDFSIFESVSDDIKSTLDSRQKSYGCFEDVSRTTCKIMEALSQNNPNGLSDLPYPHQEALHMIASKMSRLVNGDFNHKDSWHDIQGYAKLIEDLL